MQTFFSDAVLFLGVKQIQLSKFDTLLLQSVFRRQIETRVEIVSTDM